VTSNLSQEADPLYYEDGMRWGANDENSKVEKSADIVEATSLQARFTRIIPGMKIKYIYLALTFLRSKNI
jgi:hypothetical protein